LHSSTFAAWSGTLHVRVHSGLPVSPAGCQSSSRVEVKFSEATYPKWESKSVVSVRALSIADGAARSLSCRQLRSQARGWNRRPRIYLGSGQVRSVLNQFVLLPRLFGDETNSDGLIQDYPFYERPPNVALLISRAVVDPALPMMIID
jgi:hypothetical protein